MTQKNSRTHSSLSSVQQNRFKSVQGLETARLFGLFWSAGSLNCPKMCQTYNMYESSFLLAAEHCVSALLLSAAAAACQARISGRSEMSWVIVARGNMDLEFEPVRVTVQGHCKRIKRGIRGTYVTIYVHAQTDSPAPEAVTNNLLLSTPD